MCIAKYYHEPIDIFVIRETQLDDISIPWTNVFNNIYTPFKIGHSLNLVYYYSWLPVVHISLLNIKFKLMQSGDFVFTPTVI